MIRSPLDPWIARLTGISPLDPVELSRWQAERLRREAGYAREKSPFFARSLREVSLEPDGFTPARLPFTTADDLRESALDMLCVSQGEVDRIISLDTSGTSGGPKRLCFTGTDLESTLDFYRVGMATLTVPGDVLLILLPGRRPDGAADLLARALADIGVRAVLAPEPCAPEAVVELVRRESVTCMAALASTLTAVLDAGPAPGPDPGLVSAPAPGPALGLSPALAPGRADQWAGPGRVTRILTSGEPVSTELRHELAQAGVELFDHWGMTETALGGGVECAVHQGYHLREADLLVEIVDPVTGEALPDGETGELVVSTLSRRGMPLLRYRTGDAAPMLPGPCPCGSPLRRLGPIAGRIERNGDGFTVVRPKKGSANRS